MLRRYSTWFQKHSSDHFVKLSKEQNLRARSAFKLEEIQQTHKIFKPGQFVLDCGASPGGWSIVASKHVKNGSSKIVAVDLLRNEFFLFSAIEQIPGVECWQMDATSDEFFIKIESLGRKIDVVLSDMSPNLCGIQSLDHFRSIELIRSVLDLCCKFLIPNGSIVCKLFPGGKEKELLKEIQALFSTAKFVKPEASRKESTEMYIVAKGYKK